jgi:hypothetical protein
LKNIITIAISSLFLVSCSASLKDHAALEPKFDLFSYFQGETKAWGVVQDYKGNLLNRFEVKIVGTLLKKNKLKLVEDFVYENGEEQERVWLIEKLDDGSFKGEAGDIVGVAKGETSGNTLRWQYDFLLKTKDRKIKLAVDDWMFLQDESHLFNRTEMKKFGITVATVTIFFKKELMVSQHNLDYRDERGFKGRYVSYIQNEEAVDPLYFHNHKLLTNIETIKDRENSYDF